MPHTKKKKQTQTHTYTAPALINAPDKEFIQSGLRSLSARWRCLLDTQWIVTCPLRIPLSCLLIGWLQNAQHGMGHRGCNKMPLFLGPDSTFRTEMNPLAKSWSRLLSQLFSSTDRSWSNVLVHSQCCTRGTRDTESCCNYYLLHILCSFASHLWVVFQKSHRKKRLNPRMTRTENRSVCLWNIQLFLTC